MHTPDISPNGTKRATTDDDSKVCGPMNVVVASINFAPDHSGIGVYSTDFPMFLAECGHEVTMVTGFSYYPAWKKRKEDEGRLFATENHHSIRLLRGYLYVPRKVTTLARLWHEGTFCLFALINLFRVQGRPDAVVVFSPPFLLGLVAHIYAAVRRCPVIVNVQDVPLDAATSLGMVTKGPFIRFLSALERVVYRRAAAVATISAGMLETLRAKGIEPGKLELVPNWIDVAAYATVKEVGRFLSRHPEVAGKFVTVYAGNLGIKQGVDALLRLAKRVQSEPEFHFFLIGDGADKPRLLKIARELDLGNVTFLPLMEPDAYREMLADVDLVFVAQKTGAGNNFFPSKLLGLMAQGKPLLVSADPESELARRVLEWRCGRVASYDDSEVMAVHLAELCRDRSQLAMMGEAGREAVNLFDRKIVLSKWLESIQRVVNSKSRPMGDNVFRGLK